VTGATKKQSATSIVECREQLKLVGLLFVMIDEEQTDKLKLLPAFYD
jgi:hypothetical protein